MSAAREHLQEVLRQAGVALQGRAVTLWEFHPATGAVPLVSSEPALPDQATSLALDAALRHWRAPIVPGSRCVACHLDDAARWCVAPVRRRPPLPPPGGIERRSRERLVLELTGLCLGAIEATPGEGRRLSPSESAWEHARQPSVIAHEVGNHLTAAGGNLEFGIAAVRAAPSLDPDLRSRLLEDLANAAQGIEQATDYLRAIQDRSGVGPGRASRFDVTAVIRSCVTLERPLARKRGVALTWESALESTYLSGDPNALFQVVTNLIRNAVDASSEVAGVVLITLERAGDTLILAVRDRGEGIPSEHLERIFEAGFTTKQPGTGSGMGLAIVREITEHTFGGTVRVESTVEMGSTFTLVLPVPAQRRGV